MKLYLTLLLFCCSFSSLAATFTVTSNADSGPGTFRDALMQAAANGAANQIVFNLPDQSRAGRTITLLSAIPALPSSLVIDGTTQPGAPFGISNARVIIQTPASIPYFNLFEAFGASNIEIYGLYLQGLYAAGYCLHFRQASNIQFGAAGKGNIINGFAQPFNCDQVSGTDPGSSNISIQGNLMGVDETGTRADGTTLNGVSFYFVNVANLQIGGLFPGQGNLIVQQDYPMNYTCTRPDNFGYLKIEGNTIGTDVTGLVRLDPNRGAFEIDGYNDGNANVTGTTPLSIQITNNVSADGFSLFDIQSPFTIKGNHLGVGSDNITNLMANSGFGATYMLSLEYCGQGIIGGPNPGDKNYIANASAYGVFEFWCSNITISRNSFFCNGLGIEFNWMLSPRPMPFVTITLLTAGSVGGKALPGSTVELFYDDECPGCEGKTYIGTTTADNSGNWTYAVTATGAIVATATDTYGATSAFSTATINSNNIVVTNATCGRNNGSIKNIEVTSGTEWYWQDGNGHVVANSIDLTNAGPGTYTFVTSIGGAACAASSTPYTIANVSLPTTNVQDISVTQPSCGQPTGKLQYAGSFDPTASYQWLSGTNPVGPDFSTLNPFTGLAPGSYTLQVALLQDPTCLAQYGPFVLTNQSGPSINTGRIQIIPSVCGGQNGAIIDITAQGTTGTVYLGWEDSSGQVVRNTLNLVNVAAGLYRLALKDGGGCDTLFTSWYRIPDNGSISYDMSQMVITPATCDFLNGAITGIISTNATIYTWMNTATNALAGNGEDITGLGAGTYQLQFSNAYGCQAQTPAIQVRQIENPAFDYAALQVLNDTCNSGQGAIKDLKMADPARGYTWRWFDGSQIAGSTAGLLTDLHSGNYYVAVTDQYNCTVSSNLFTIQDIELMPPTPQVSDQYIPRNTPTIVTIGNPQTGTYELLDNAAPGATVLATSTSATLTTPVITEDETFYVRFTRGDCVSSLAPVHIRVFDSVQLFIPNAFTPDKDANNRWRVIARGLVNSIHIAVFDRWGTEVFASNDVNAAWDGTYGGHAVSGTFAYIIVGKDYYNKPFKARGTVIVIR
jgi:gliding motility-associated-like protein